VTPSVGEVSDANLQQHFSKYGHIIDISRPLCGSNFAFISFNLPECIDKAFADDHFIDGVEMNIRRTREFDVNKRVSAKKQQQPKQTKTATILISADPSIMKHINTDDLKTFFEKFGKVIGVRKPTARSETTHFAFVQFSSSDAVDKAMRKSQLNSEAFFQ
jgi:RNA recognition motif-containing protein